MALSGLPRPKPDLDTAPFWEGTKQARFLIPRCTPNQHPRWPPGPMCPECQSIETDWVDASGHGTVYSWVVVTHPVDPVLVDQVPYAVAMIDLEEGVRVVGNVAGCPPEDLAAGMAVRLYFQEADPDGIRLPNFERA
jgi:uncharacterized OB-fold protein